MKLRLSMLTLILLAAGSFAREQTIAVPPEAPEKVRFAAAEIRRYVYLRTGELLEIRTGGPDESDRSDGRIVLKTDPGLAAEQYRLKTEGAGLVISGGSDIALLYGVYAFAEKLGVRFYLHGDVIPDERIPFALPVLDETGSPLFALRGVNPWGSHPFGFDAWSADDYKAVITQLAKMRMNFIGMHCYPEGHPYAEPTVWHGLADDVDGKGRVRASYPSRYFNTLLTSAWGDYIPKKTADYSFGGSLLFERDDWAPPVLAGHCPLPETPEACNNVFNRMGAQFQDAFSFARQLGVKTCLGTEAPLTLPKALAARTTDVKAVYEGTFRRIMAAHPLDYYWIWTEENWTWRGNKPEQYNAVAADIKLAHEALKRVDAPFHLATAGWVLGPAHDRAALDRDLPKDIPMSAISRSTGAVEVDPAFGRIAGREKWAIPWLESDNREGLAGVQLFAGRMRRDATDAHDYGCTGLMGLHWRTQDVGPNASALAQAAWDQTRGATNEWSVAGQVAAYPDATITGSPDAPLYRTCRYDLGEIRLRAPAGTYRVTLKFCEPHFDAAGQRICDVAVQGRTVLSDFDIFAEVGKFAALDRTFDGVAVTNGVLRIELIARKSLPAISAIAVEGAGFTRRINLGGAAYQDWQADAGKPRNLPVDDFYADWARANFGLAEAGRVFAAIDGRVPQVTDGGCPSGRLKPDDRAWEQVAPQFTFVDDFEKLRTMAKGAGNLERFDYWLNTFKYLRALAKTRCAMGAKQPETMTKAWAEAYTCLLATVNTPGGLAMVVNMENHPGWGATVAAHANQPWPKEYQGSPRLIVPCVRSVLNQGEALRLKIIALPASQPSVHFRSMGGGEWKVIPAAHVNRGVYEASLPIAHEDFEYYVTAGENLVWPATAPGLNQTVVIVAQTPKGVQE